VQFYLTPELKKALASYFIEEDIKIFCDEAQLPNISTGTGSITGRYLGESQVNYATSRVFSTFQLGWMLTSDLLPLKFIQSWNDYIFGENMLSQKPGSGLESMRTTDRLNAKRPVRLAYPDEYRCNIRITKTEMGPESTQEKAPITYVMENCWPAEVDAVPLSYGNTQVVKFTAQFQYERHYVVMNDTTQQTFKQVDTLYDENGRYIGVK